MRNVPGVASAEDAVGKGISGATQSSGGQAVSGAIQKFANQNPDVAQAFKDASDLTSGVGITTGVAGAYGAIKNKLAQRALLSTLTSAGAEDPEGVANTLAEHGITAGKATQSQAIATIKNAIANASDTLGGDTTNVALQNHIHSLEDTLQALQSPEMSNVYNAAIKSSGGLLGSGFTTRKALTGLLGADLLQDPAKKGLGYLKNLFLGQTPTFTPSP